MLAVVRNCLSTLSLMGGTPNMIGCVRSTPPETLAVLDRRNGASQPCVEFDGR